MWHIYFIMWVSWAWKWTLISNIKKLKLPNIYFPLSYKTRQIRENETNWVDAWFITREDFFSQVQYWKFLEYALVYWLDYYWTKYEDIIEKWINKWKIVIKEIDINGLIELKRNKPELDSRYTTIFLNMPSETLTQRIKKRWVFMSNDELEKRINTSITELNRSKELCNYIIDATKTPDEILRDFLEIINKTWKYI